MFCDSSCFILSTCILHYMNFVRFSGVMVCISSIDCTVQCGSSFTGTLFFHYEKWPERARDLGWKWAFNLCNNVCRNNHIPRNSCSKVVESYPPNKSLASELILCSHSWLNNWCLTNVAGQKLSKQIHKGWMKKWTNPCHSFLAWVLSACWTNHVAESLNFLFLFTLKGKDKDE